jgi:hypothetical protein
MEDVELAVRVIVVGYCANCDAKVRSREFDVPESEFYSLFNRYEYVADIEHGAVFHNNHDCCKECRDQD